MTDPTAAELAATDYRPRMLCNALEWMHVAEDRAEAAEARVATLTEALRGLMDSMRGVVFSDEQAEAFAEAWMRAVDVLAARETAG